MPGFVARASEGRVVGRKGKKKGSMSGAELSAYNAQFGRFAKTDTKRSLKFASKRAFEAWLGGLGPGEQEKYSNWKVQETEEDGKLVVYVYKDLDNNGIYEANKDQLIAVNGQRFVRSNATKRRDYADFRVDNPRAQYSKYKRVGGGGKLSAFNLVAKVVGAQCKKLEQSFRDAKSYSIISSEIYTPMRDWLIATFRQKFHIPKMENESGVDLSIAKITRDPIFKACVLDMLATNTAEVSAVIAGQGVGNLRPTLKLDALVAADLAGDSEVITAICTAAAEAYKPYLNLQALLRGFGLDSLVVLAPEDTYGEERHGRQGDTHARGPKYVMPLGGFVAAPARRAARPDAGAFRQTGRGVPRSDSDDEARSIRRTRPRFAPPPSEELGSVESAAGGI
jgi:hypothetical protein